MVTPNYEAAASPVREDLATAHHRAWQRIAAPGPWWDGPRRVAIAAETRNAAMCTFCREAKTALSPYSVAGDHQSLGALPGPLVDVIHRTATDPGRLTWAWFERALAGGLSEDEFVETIGIVVTTIAVDIFNRAIGLPPPPLLAPESGVPKRSRPVGAKPGPAWVKMVAPVDITADEACLEKVYPSLEPTYIRCALSLVPAEACGLFDMVDAQYLPPQEMTDPASRYRAIARAQMELIAGRVSAINGCFY